MPTLFRIFGNIPVFDANIYKKLRKTAKRFQNIQQNRHEAGFCNGLSRIKVRYPLHHID